MPISDVCRFLDVVAAASTAVRNPAHVTLSVSAVHTLQSLARRLAECLPQVIGAQAPGFCCVSCLA